MKEITLTRGMVALVDDEDFERLAAHKWCALKAGKRGGFYAARAEAKHTVLMHREIMGAQKGTKIDHENRNGIDNQKRNLRICTQRENCLNSIAHCDKRTSQYKGVYRHKQNGNWVAEFRGKHLGSFGDEEHAARCYDAAATAAEPAYARTNFLDRRA